MNDNFTPTEKRIYDLLADGEGHTREEVLLCINGEATKDEPSDLSCMYNHVSQLRGKLKMIGQDIVAQKIGYRTYYRRVRHLIIRQD